MRTLFTRIATAIAALACAAAAQAATVSFTPASQHVNVGDVVSVDVSISGLGAEVLAGMDLNFFWNAAILGGAFRSFDANSAYEQLGNGFGVAPIALIDVTSPGEWGLQMVALEDDATLAAHQADSFLIARMSFSADADGATTLWLGSDPDFERSFLGLNAVPLTLSIDSACISVGTGSCGGTAPEPSGGLLTVAALAAMALPLRSRRRRAG